MTDDTRAALVLLDAHSLFDPEDGNYRVEGGTWEAVRAALAASATDEQRTTVERKPLGDPRFPGEHFVTARPAVPTLDVAWAEAEAALPEHHVIRKLERRDGEESMWDVYTGVPDPHSRTADYGYGPGNGDGGWGGDWAEGPTPAEALRALRARLSSEERPRRTRAGRGGTAGHRAARLAGLPMTYLHERCMCPECMTTRTGLPFTPQQMAVVRLAAQGLRNRQIADELHCSPDTVKAHLSLALARAHCTRRRELRGLL